LDVWKGYHGVERTGVLFVPQAVPFLVARAVDQFLDELTIFCTPALVVFDTLPRCMPGANETSHEHMSLAMRAAAKVIEGTGAAVLFVTHPRLDGDRPRGHTSQDAAADAIWSLEEEGDDRVLKCRKMKDALEPEPTRLRLFPSLDSALLVPADLAGIPQTLTKVRRAVLETIRAIDTGTGVAATLIIDSGKLPKSSVYRSLKELSDAGLAREGKGRWGVTATGLAMLQAGRVSPVSPKSHASLIESHGAAAGESPNSPAPLYKGADWDSRDASAEGAA
jgi:hypothetical protein